MPALMGPCYWIVAGGTPVGWRGGCLALGMVRGALRHYCFGRCSSPVVCVRRSRLVRGGWGRCRVLCLLCFPLPALRFLRCLWQAVPSECPLSSLAGTPFHAVCAFCGLGPAALLVVPACPLCVCAWGGAARSRFPLPGFRLRAPREVGAGVGTRHQPHSARSCELALRAGLARCRGGTRAFGGGASCLGAGRPGSGALPAPTSRPFGRAAGAHYQLAVDARGAGAGIRHQPHSARSCELALRAVGAA